MALRIHARAYERAAKLMKLVPKATGKKAADRPFSKSQKAKEAGLTQHQRKIVQRVGNVPQDYFDERVESDNPPTISQLAEIGTKHRLVDLEGRSPKDYALSTQVQGKLEDLVSIWPKPICLPLFVEPRTSSAPGCWSTLHGQLLSCVYS